MVRHHFGAIYDWRAVEEWAARSARPLFAAAAQPLLDSGKGKVALPFEYLAEAAGAFPIRKQTAPDCVSHAWALAVDMLAALEIIAHGESERWAGETATEPIYGGSRIEIGRGRLGNGGGSLGSWGARAVQELGTVVRGVYGQIDLRRYSGQRANEWGRPGHGVPDELEPTMARHVVRATSLVTSYEQARDAIANGFPVVVCSTQGFTSKRDSLGFAKASGTWAHAMCLIGVDDANRRPGCLCMNSWGPNWISGPKRHGQPDGSFWIDADVVDRMLRRNSDSYTCSQFEGYPAQAINHRLRRGARDGRRQVAV